MHVLRGLLQIRIKWGAVERICLGSFCKLGSVGALIKSIFLGVCCELGGRRGALAGSLKSTDGSKLDVPGEWRVLMDVLLGAVRGSDRITAKQAVMGYTPGS